MNYITNNIEEIINSVFFGGMSLFGFIKLLIIIIKQKNYIKVQGVVISTSKTHLGFFTKKGSHNKYQYDYNGKTYYIEDNFYGGNPKLNIGDNVDVYVSPKNHKKILKPEELYLRKVYFVFFICGFISLFLY